MGRLWRGYCPLCREQSEWLREGPFTQPQIAWWLRQHREAHTQELIGDAERLCREAVR